MLIEKNIMESPIAFPKKSNGIEIKFPWDRFMWVIDASNQKILYHMKKY